MARMIAGSMPSKSSTPRLSPDWIDDDALEIVHSLQGRGFASYLVGGCVRDLLAGVHPKDFDIATNATPEEVRRAVRRAYVIGRRFRLVLVRRGEKQFEVATFRREVKPDEFPEGAPAGDNLFGTPEEDARRRDFTLNGLLYDPISEDLIDHVGGVTDIEQGIVRMIGDPVVRLTEDPIRILRGLRLAHKLGFRLEESLRAAMVSQAGDLEKAVLPRKREEYLKILRLENPELTFVEMNDLQVLGHCLPSLVPVLEDADRARELRVYFERFSSLPVDLGQPVFLFGALVLTVFRIMVSGDPLRAWTAEEILAQGRMERFLFEELGMHKSEVGNVLRALSLQPILAKGQDFWRRGERRRAAVLRDEAFPLALMMAEMDNLMPLADLQKWEDEFQKAQRV